MTSPSGLLMGWMNSPLHRAQILVDPEEATHYSDEGFWIVRNADDSFGNGGSVQKFNVVQ